MPVETAVLASAGWRTVANDLGVLGVRFSLHKDI